MSAILRDPSNVKVALNRPLQSDAQVGPGDARGAQAAPGRVSETDFKDRFTSTLTFDECDSARSIEC